MLFPKQLSSQHPPPRNLNRRQTPLSRRSLHAELAAEGILHPVADIGEANAVDLWRSARVVVDPPSTPTQAKFKTFTLDNGVTVPMSNANIIAANGINYYVTTDELGEEQKKPIHFGE